MTLTPSFEGPVVCRYCKCECQAEGSVGIVGRLSVSLPFGLYNGVIRTMYF